MTYNLFSPAGGKIPNTDNTHMASSGKFLENWNKHQLSIGLFKSTTLILYAIVAIIFNYYDCITADLEVYLFEYHWGVKVWCWISLNTQNNMWMAYQVTVIHFMPNSLKLHNWNKLQLKLIWYVKSLDLFLFYLNNDIMVFWTKRCCSEFR